MSKILDNSIWPNGLKEDSEGYAVYYPLGNNKKDISSITWPEGYKLVSPFVYDSNGKVVGFCDTKSLTVSGNTTTIMPYYHIEANFAAISEGTLTVDAPNAIVKKFKWAIVQNDNGSYDYVIIDLETADQATIDAVRSAYRVVDKTIYAEDDSVIGTWDTSKLEVGGNFDMETLVGDGLFCNLNTDGITARGLILSEFNSDLSSLSEGALMFDSCAGLTSFDANLSNLTNGSMMFTYCTNLESFSSNLSSLTTGFAMFFSCENLKSFTSDLPSLTSGLQMFMICSNLESFSSNLASLTDGGFMFCDCSNLTSFTSDLPSLTDGSYMFCDCTNLTTFSSDLPSLTSGQMMFDSCKLDASSVKNIIDTINIYSDDLTLGMGCNNTSDDKNLFAQEAGYANMASLLGALQAKGWTVTTQYNGRPSATYSLRRPSTEGTLPVFVKLEEVEDTNDKRKSNHTHTSEDGSKKYRLRWFHETTGSTEGYTQYATLEEAVEALNIKPIERN